MQGEYLNGDELKEGFDENLEYFRLDFLDPDDVARRQEFAAIAPILWLMTGAQGPLETGDSAQPFFLPAASPLAVLLDERQFGPFTLALAERPEITHVFIVTDSPDAFADMSAVLGRGRYQIRMLYKDYLSNFRINQRQRA